MPSIPYINQTAPFWDFIASLEEQGSHHPFFAQFNNNPPPPHPSSNPNTNDRTNPDPFPQHHPFGPWGWIGTGFPFGNGGEGIPHRPRGGGGPGGPHRHHHHHHEHGETEEEEEEEGEKQFEKDFEEELNKEFGGDDNAEKETLDKEKENEEEGNDNGEGPSTTNSSGSETEGFCGRRRGRGGRGGRRGEHCGGARRDGGRHGCGAGGPRGWGWGGHGHGHGHGYGYGHGPHHHHHPHGHGHGRRGGWGGGGRGGPFFFSGGRTGEREGQEGPQHPFNPLAFLAPLFSPPTNNNTTSNDDFTPEADIFDTPTSYIIHISLPGAKKEDVGVNWDAEKSELSVAGVVYRPADEKLLEQLAMTERKVGAFERKVRLGTRANPANVDADGISAKLEDGVLRVEVRKMGDGGFVEVRRVDIE